MNKADIDYIIEKLDSYKPDNIYDGCNSVREKQDQRVSEVLDSLKAEFESDYENMRTPTPKELVLTFSPKQMEETKEHIDELVKQFVEDIEIKYNWIKCSEKMPENGKSVLVAVYGTDILTVEDDSFESLQKAIEDSQESVRYTTMACYISGDGWYSEGYPMIIAPTYWMLLPEPPKDI